MKLLPQKAPVIGRKKVRGFVESLNGHSGFGEFEVDEHPPSFRGEALRKARVENGLALRQVATLAGIRVSEWSGLEMGEMMLDDSGWEHAMRIVRGGKP